MKKMITKQLLKTGSLLFLFWWVTVHASAQKPDGSGKESVAPKGSDMQKFPNGIIKIAPASFGVTEAVRNLPTSVENAKAKSEAYLTKEKLAMLRKEELRKKGVTEAEIEKEEINKMNAKIIKKVLPNAGAGQGDFQDPLVNRNKEFNTQRSMLMPTPVLSFDGASQTDNAAQGIGAVLPPDVNGDVGLNHYVSSVNLVYKIFNKNGTVAAGPFKTNSLFNGLPANDPCRVNNSGDPIVIYDPLADRWHISQFAITGTTNCQCVAVSQTGDPTGAYYVWRYDYPNNIFNDYPKVGVWPDAYHMTFNQFNNAGTAFLGLGILSQDRPKALVGDPAASVVYTNIAILDPGAAGGLPADVDGLVPPPVGMAEVIAEYRANEFGDPIDGIRYYKWVPDFITPGNSSITVLPDVALAAFDARNPSGRGDIEQSGGANLDALGDRMMHRFAYRNLGTLAAPVNSFVGNFTVNVSGVNPTSAATYQTGIRWFEMRRTGDAFSVFDEGTHHLTPGNGAAGLNNWMGSIAQDNAGNIALGFSQSSTTQRADIKIAGRTNNVMNSGILNEGEALFHAATGSQQSTSNRWGDYSSMNVDPVDDCTFWYTQEYYATTGNATWSTRIGSFGFPSCTPPPKATITGTITSCASGLPINLALVGASGGYNRVTGAAGTYSMTVAPGTYTISASKTGGFAGSTSPTVTVVNGQTLTVDICMTGIPILAASTATLISESCSPANGIIDPGETVTVAFAAQNTGVGNTVNDIGTLQLSGGIISTGGPQSYGVLPAGGAAVSTNFTFTADPLMQCGSNIIATIAHADGLSNLGNITYTFTTGITGTAITTSYTGPPVAIPDNNTTGVDIVLPVSGVSGNINDLNFRLDALAGCDVTIGNTNAAVTHTFNEDLVFKLTSPAGTTVTLISQRGGSANNFCTVLLDDDGAFPATSSMPTTGAVTGNFAPENPLSAFDGQNANGNWTLNVSDRAGVDVGTLNRFSLIITGTVCCTATCNVTGSGTTSPVSCIGNTDGTATITLAGLGSGAPGTYTLDGGAPQAFATNPFIITNLAAGNHTIVATVTAGGCVSGDIVVNVANAATLTATVDKTNVSACSAVNDGTITITPAGGSGNYTYSWTGSTGLGNANQTPFTAGNVSSLTGLTYGFYNVTITDAGGCGTLTINNIHVGFAFVVIVTNNGSISSSCGIPVGSISLYGNAGVPPYTFSIDGSNYQAGNTFTGLAAASYTGYVKDATGCVGTKPGIVIGTAAPLVVLPFTKAASSCGSDGTIEIYRSGGIGPYTYSLDDITYQSGNIFSNKAAGNYTAYVKDSKGCVSSAPATVGQGASLVVTAVTTSSSICLTDGTFRLNATGGSSPYTYSLDNITYQPGNAFTGLAAGNYIGYVKDFKGCTGQVNVIIGSNTINVTSFVIAASGCAASNGSIQLFRTGGTGPYTYSLDGNIYQSSTLFTGLGAGTYDGYVKDSKACIAVQNGIVVGPTGCAPPFAGTTRTNATNILVQEKTEQRVQVYPNPSQTEFTLMLTGYKHTENVSVTVTDVLGRKIYQTAGKGKLLYKFGNDFNTGVYNVEVIQGNEKNSIKIVKK